jgi:thiol-disulfide isomerase/thioredoxin
LSIGNFFQQKSNDSLALASIFRTQRETQHSFEEAAKETIAIHFIKANTPYIPEGFENIKTYINNLKTHFFDHVDFNNEILQSSNFLTERILNYVFGMFTEAENDTIAYEKNIDDVFVAMKAAQPEIKKTLLEVLWQQMVDANFENVANYISDNYLIKLAETLNDTELVDGLKLFKSLSIGKTAPNFSWEVDKGAIKTTQQLRSLKTAENYILVFWSSTCSHCLKEVPELQAYLKTLETGKFQVVAVGLEDDSVHWKKEILKYPEFIHVLGLGKWQNKIGKRYNVSATPTYYILDMDKKIIGKPNDYEALKKFISN